MAVRVDDGRDIEFYSIIDDGRKVPWNLVVPMLMDVRGNTILSFLDTKPDISLYKGFRFLGLLKEESDGRAGNGVRIREWIEV